ncbi:hypothetical protein ASF62_12180 [Leifsonia sp. Leaf325]|nr:O-antigen ligase family protein [Leifsonia sp. Leaf325]KQQ92601.1 hypothetical protein ASF62_12180 [Leifsonia sp. Leaf325]
MSARKIKEAADGSGSAIRGEVPSGRVAHYFGPAVLAVLVFAGQLKENPALRWFPIDLTLTAAVAVVLCMVITRIRMGPASKWIVLPIALWLAFLPAIVIGPLDEAATTKVLTLYTVTLALAVAPFQLLRSVEQRRAFLLSIAAIAVLAATWAMLVSPTRVAEYTSRILLEGTNTIGTARIAMAGAIVLLLYSIMRGMRSGWRVVFAIVGVAVSFLAFSTGSRGPVLSAGVALLTALVFLPVFRRYRVRAIVSVVSVGIVAIAIAAANASDGYTRVFSILLGEEDNSSETRLYLWQVADAQIARSPFGSGWGSYGVAGIYTYPHNMILELGVEAGWLVTAIVCLVLIAGLCRSVRLAVEPTMAIMFALLVFALLNALVSGDINGNRLLWPTLFAAWAGVAAVRASTVDTVESDGPRKRLS